MPADLLRRFALALCVWREARGESVRGKTLVAQVIANRVADPRWPNTVSEVVLQPKQFSSFNRSDPNSRKFPTEGDPAWIESVTAADVVLTTENPITTSNHYHTTAVHPAWADPDLIVAREGAHIFYTL